MFCHSLRRRPSWASAVSRWTTPSASLRLLESQLDTHDVEVPLAPSASLTIGQKATARKLRVLLLSPSSVTADQLEATVKRIQRFASLTGGRDVVMIFLLSPAQPDSAARFVSAKDVATGRNEHDSEGIVAYATLQAELLNHAEIPHIPVLPLPKADGFLDLLKKHTFSLLNASMTHTNPPKTAAFELLRRCTVNPPMQDRTARYLTDLFSNLRELAQACAYAPPACDISSQATHNGTMLSSEGYTHGVGTQLSDESVSTKLQDLFDLVGGREYDDVVDFWRTENAV